MATSTSGQESNVELSEIHQGDGADLESGLRSGYEDSRTEEQQNNGSALEHHTTDSEEYTEEDGETEDQRQKRLERVEEVKKQLAVEQGELRVKLRSKLRLYQEEENKSAKSYYKGEETKKKREAKKREVEPLIEPTSKRPPKDLSFSEIKNLVFIENSPIHKKALEEWERKEKLFSSRVERKSTKVGNLKNEVYQLIGFFSVFQGVVLTAVSQSNLLHCNNKWYPISLSALASAVTIAAIAQKLYQISSFQETIYSEEASLKDAVHRSQELRREGKKFKFAKFAKDKQIAPKRDCFRLFYSIVVVGFLLAFTALFPVSFWKILCNPGWCGTAPSPT
ncbi:hypothetical protein M758_3G024500 [Ceratodon purpureus]|nr:hypothetical protein M758_3G024500 [Ceratodon purpureus]